MPSLTALDGSRARAGGERSCLRHGDDRGAARLRRGTPLRSMVSPDPLNAARLSSAPRRRRERDGVAPLIDRQHRRLLHEFASYSQTSFGRSLFVYAASPAIRFRPAAFMHRPRSWRRQGRRHLTVSIPLISSSRRPRVLVGGDSRPSSLFNGASRHAAGHREGRSIRPRCAVLAPDRNLSLQASWRGCRSEQLEPTRIRALSRARFTGNFGADTAGGDPGLGNRGGAEASRWRPPSPSAAGRSSSARDRRHDDLSFAAAITAPATRSARPARRDPEWGGGRRPRPSWARNIQNFVLGPSNALRWRSRRRDVFSADGRLS